MPALVRRQNKVEKEKKATWALKDHGALKALVTNWLLIGTMTWKTKRY